jgi:hypothetical protein
MALYFDRDDLTARINKTQCWTHEEALKLTKNLKYEGRIDDCRLANLSLVIAYIKVVECYTPITSDDDDFNCITEAEAEQIFENISKITGLCFVPKNTDYIIDTDDDNNQFREILNTSGVAITDALGEPIFTAVLTKEKLTR